MELELGSPFGLALRALGKPDVLVLFAAELGQGDLLGVAGMRQGDSSASGCAAAGGSGPPGPPGFCHPLFQSRPPPPPSPGVWALPCPMVYGAA